MNAAANTLISDGDLKPFLSGYHTILQSDVGHRAFDYSEDYHRGRLLVTLLEYRALTTTAEYEVVKVSCRIAKSSILGWNIRTDCCSYVQKTGSKGYLDLRIKTKNFLVVVELKVIQIHYLELGAGTLSEKAKELANMSLDKILKLKFSKSDKFNRGKSVEKFVNEKVGPQLKGYILGSTVKTESVDVRGLAVVIIGNRKVLVREMDGEGKWRTDGNSKDWLSKDGFCLVQPMEPA